MAFIPIPEILSVQFQHHKKGAYGSMGYFMVVACQVWAGEDTTRGLPVLDPRKENFVILIPLPSVGDLSAGWSLEGQDGAELNRIFNGLGSFTVRLVGWENGAYRSNVIIFLFSSSSQHIFLDFGQESATLHITHAD